MLALLFGFVFQLAVPAETVIAVETVIEVDTTAELVNATRSDAQPLTIRVAKGTYSLTEQLKLKSGTKLIGAGEDKTVITHHKDWKASTESLPDPESRLKGMDTDAYLIRLADKAVDVEVSGLTLRGPDVHGAIFGFNPTKFSSA